MTPTCNRRQFNRALASSSLIGPTVGYPHTFANDAIFVDSEKVNTKTAVGANVAATVHPIAPNKRPLSSMSPTIVLSKNGTPFLTCGAAGGPKIINATLQNIVRCIDLNEPIDRAIASARIHHQWRPDVVYHEPNLGGLCQPMIDNRDTNSEVTLHLTRLGHPLKAASSLAIAQGIQKTSGGLLAATDPRTDGLAIAMS